MTNDSKERSGSIPIASIQWDFSWPELAKEDDRRHLYSYIEHRFGISQTHFADYLLFQKKKSWFLIGTTDLMRSASQLRVTQVGLRAFRRVGDFVKPTTRFIQSFGRFATRAKLKIDMTQLQALLKGEKIEVDLPLDNGYVILVIGEDRVLGLGLYINGNIGSQLPKKEIRTTMLAMAPGRTIAGLNQNKEDASC